MRAISSPNVPAWAAITASRRSGTFTDQVIRGMMVLVPDLKQNAQLLQTYLYGKTVN